MKKNRQSLFEFMVAIFKQSFKRKKSRISPDDKALATFALPSGGLYPTAVSPRQWEHAFSHESVREWYQKIGSILRAPDRILRRHVIAVDETKLKLQGQFVFVWSAVDIRRYEVPLLKA